MEYELDELESDEVYHALLGRKADLDKIVKNLEERDGLPEAAQATRGRIELYTQNGEGDEKRPGLLRLFAPQRDIEADIASKREAAGETRAADGSADLFGGGTEVGGGIPAGRRETLPENPSDNPSDASEDPPAERPNRSRKKKVVTEAAATGEADGADDDRSPEWLNESRLIRLDGLARDLLNGDMQVGDDVYLGFAASVMDLLPKVHPTIDGEHLHAQLYEEFNGAEDNAHQLAYFIQRMADQARDAYTKPIGRREDAHGGPPTAKSDPALTDTNLAVGSGSVEVVTHDLSSTSETTDSDALHGVSGRSDDDASNAAL